VDAALEANLIEAARRGTRRAFGNLVEHYQARLHRSACCLTRGAADAEDLAQETFVRAYMGLGRFRGDCAFYTWLFGILLNVYRRWLRRQRREPSRHDENAAVEAPDPHPSPGRQAAVADELGRVFGVIEHLPRRLREVLVLRHVEEMSYDEIARAVGCRVGTVRSRLHRAREFLAVKWRQARGERKGRQS